MLQVERYQEFGQLLDPHLEGWIMPLAAVLRAQAHIGDDADMTLVQRVSRVLHAFATVRGYKTVVKFFPHEAKDLEPVVALLVRSHDAAMNAASPAEAEELGSAWETRATLILWLSILVLIPFDLVTVDSQVCDGGEDGAAMAAAGGAGAEAPPVVMRILDLCQKKYLADPGIVRDRAAFLLARLLTRPDMPVALAAFLDWATRALACAGSSAPDDELGDITFLVPGVARSLAAIFKLGTRGALLGVAERAWGDARDLAMSPAAAGSALVRQLACKVTQRIGLLFLKPRVVAWRYERGARSLVDNLAAAAGSTAAVSVGGNDAESVAAPLKMSAEQGEEEEEEEDWDIPDGVEEVIEALLTALRDKDTVVRWSAAKGLGRVTARLPAELGDEVVGSILECFSPTEGDSTWHGACLALAELARRGLLLPERLPDAVPHVAAALSYDIRRGPHSVGAHVRDAAAYVCWAFARAYAPDVLAPHASALAPSLLVTACFDREVNCRRAAAAAFQEAVGRLGAFPHGIDIVAAADYFALGSRVNAYVKVADFVCGFDEYRPRLLTHLCDVKLGHWERATRELAARAIGVVGKRDPDWVRSVALPALLRRALSPALEARHGATVGAAEALLALRDAGEPVVTDDDRVDCGAGQTEGLASLVVGLVDAVEKARLYRGKGGEVMRAAVCRYVECLAAVGQPLDKGPGPATGPKSLRSSLLNSVEESLKHPTADIRDAAVGALRQFAVAYMCGAKPEAGAKRLVVKLAGTLGDDPNPAARRGAALALGVMPAALLRAGVPSGAGAEGAEGAGEGEMIPSWRMALDILKAATVPEEDAEARDAEARVCAVRGMAGLLSTLQCESSGSGERAAAAEVVDALLGCMEDYCTDNRGDVGSWVREAAMDALPAAVAAAQAGGALESGTATRIISALLKQTAEKIDRTRAAAATALVAMLRGRASAVPPLAPLDHVPAHDVLLGTAPKDEAAAGAWAAPASAFGALVPLIVGDDVAALATYRASLVEGVIVSAGGVGDSLGKAAGGALVAALKGNEALQSAVADELVAVLRRRAGIDRVTIPLLRVLDLLFSAGALSAVAPAYPAAPGPFASELANSLRAELKGSRDIAKLCLGVQALGHLAALGPGSESESGKAEEQARVSAMHGLLALMVNRYPRVRRVAAEQMYVLLLGFSDDQENGPGGGVAMDVEAAIDQLSDTRWDAELTVVKPERNKLYRLLGMTPPAAAATLAKGPGARVKVVDENDSYAALVGSAGY